MKVVNRGFSITEIDVPGVIGIDVIGVEGEETITVVFGPAGQNLSFSRQEWRAFSATVAAVNERLNGESSREKVIIDGDGDKWRLIEGTDKYVYGEMTKTREQIEDAFGIRED